MRGMLDCSSPLSLRAPLFEMIVLVLLCYSKEQSITSLPTLIHVHMS